MKKAGVILFLLLLLAKSAWAGGDEIILKDGTHLKGNIVARNAAQYYIDVDHEIKRIDASEIETIHFGPAVVNPSVAALPAPSKTPAP